MPRPVRSGGRRHPSPPRLRPSPGRDEHGATARGRLVGRGSVARPSPDRRAGPARQSRSRPRPAATAQDGREPCRGPAGPRRQRGRPGRRAAPAPEQETPPRERAGHRREDQHPGEHRADEDRLVLGAELRDGPLLDRSRRQVDHRRADGQHGRGRRVGERGDQVARSDAEERREDAVRGEDDPALMGGFVARPPTDCRLRGAPTLRQARRLEVLGDVRWSRGRPGRRGTPGRRRRLPTVRRRS